MSQKTSPMKTESSQLVDAKTLAEVLGLPPASVRRLARGGRLGPVYRAGRLLRFNVEEVLSAIKEGERDATSTAQARR